MTHSIGVRELLHNFSKYLSEVKEGDCITVMERHVPVADIIPHNGNIRFPGWKRPVSRIKVKGESFSETVARERNAE